MSHPLLTEEEKTAICARYAQTGSFRAVSGEFGISPMRVKRTWEALGESERNAFRTAVAGVRQEAAAVLVQSELADDYLDSVIRARNAAIGELCRRLTDESSRRRFSDKNLIAACKILHDLSGAEKPQEGTSIFMQLSQQLHNEINHYYIHDDGKQTEADSPPAGDKPGGTGPDR